ncbi:MAG TPA: DUF5994 family protein [Jatrophihabitantaceae bacterium]|jgi:hypothetical protein
MPIVVDQVRLLLAEHPTLRDHLHGAWWPRSGDITGELAPLLRVVAARARVVFGVALNRDEWPGAPLALHPTITGRVKVAWYGLSEPHLMVLRLDRQRKLALLVVPPETLENVALAAMLMASQPGNDRTTTDVLARAAARTATIAS